MFSLLAFVIATWRVLGVFLANPQSETESMIQSAQSLVPWLNAIGLCLGFAGALGLAVLTRVFITINPDGTQSWGPPSGMDDEEWKRQNRRLSAKQKYGVPISYLAVAVGFLLQFLALILPALVGAYGCPLPTRSRHLEQPAFKRLHQNDRVALLDEEVEECVNVRRQLLAYWRVQIRTGLRMRPVAEDADQAPVGKIWLDRYVDVLDQAKSL